MIWIICGVVLIGLYFLHRHGLEALPEHLRYKWHNDYIYPFCFVPRSLTSLKAKRPPRLLAGSKALEWTSKSYSDGHIYKGADPVQHIAGAWALTFPLHLTFTIGLKNSKGFQVRLGIRWDTIDDYYNIFGLNYRVIDTLDNDGKGIVYYRGVARW